MSVLTVILYALVVAVALLLIGLILIQPSKSGGMGAAFGGVGESVFGAQAGSHLTKATVIMTALFFLVSLFLAALIGHGIAQDDSANGVTAVLEQATSSAVNESTPSETPKSSPNEAPADGKPAVSDTEGASK